MIDRDEIDTVKDLLNTTDVWVARAYPIRAFGLEEFSKERMEWLKARKQFSREAVDVAETELYDD